MGVGTWTHRARAAPWLWGAHTLRPIRRVNTQLVPAQGAGWPARTAACRQSLPARGLPHGSVQARCCDPLVTVLSSRSFLLTAVALLSSYSIHLLLKSSGIVGECRVPKGAVPGGPLPTLTPPLLPVPQASAPTSSWATEPSARQGSWPRPLPSRCRTSEVRTGLGGDAAGQGRDGTGARWRSMTLVCPAAMSSYLYIVKSEVPLVIQTFLNLEEKTT